MRAPTGFPVLLSVLLTALLLPVSALAALELAPDAPERYVVRSGDTLWDISGRFLRDPWRWGELWRANPDVGDPGLIYPGDVLELTVVAGEPRLQRTRGGRSETRGRDGIRVVKLSPRVRVSSLEDAVPTIPISSIAPFLSQPYVADSNQIDEAPYVVGFPDEHLVAGLGDSIYVRRIDSNADANFQILRPGEQLRDPDSNESLGFVAALVANAALERVGDPAKLRITRSEMEVAIGDRAIPSERERALENFFPRPAPPGTRANILAVMNGVSQIGQYDVVIINRGSRERIEPGQVLEAYVGGQQARDQVRGGRSNWNWREETPLSTEFWYGDYAFKGWLQNEPDANAPLPLHADMQRGRGTYIKPFERAGVLMVFRVFDRVSFALVLDATRAMSVGDRLASPPS